MQIQSAALRKIWKMVSNLCTTFVFTLIAGSALISLASEASAEPVDRYALLIGIDRYSQPSNLAGRFEALKGPPNDVVLVRKLLVEKYGFKDDAEHIVTLIGPQATHSAIAHTFETHLIEHAKKHPGAIATFYFSGHGSQANKIDQGDTSWHDTLVAYDSRADGGHDIVDNEVVGWFEHLRQYTPNAVFILDSCHSGSAIRDVGSLVRRELPPNPSQSEAAGSDARSIAPAAQGDDRALSRRQQFTLLSASLADESSYEDQLQTQAGPKYHGYFTYYLDQTLRLVPQSTAEQAVRNTTLALATARPHPPNQHPQAVGDIERLLFGGPADRDDPFIPIIAPPNGNSFKIGAGEINGLKPGAFLAVYASNARHLSGDTDKIANAKVVKVDAFTSSAELSGEPRQALTQQARVKIVTPYFGFERMHVRVSALLNQETTSDDLRFLQRFAAALKNNQLLDEASTGDRFDLAVRRGCIIGRQHFINASELHDGSGGPCTSDTYYMTEASGDWPLFDFYVSANDPKAATDLADRAIGRAKQTNLLGLQNEQSPMRGQVRIKLIKVELVSNPAGGRPNIRQIASSDDRTNAIWKIGDHFQVQIENKTDQDIYAAAIMLGTSGAIELISTDPHGYLMHAHTSMVLPAPRRVGPPVGIETYKLVASTSPTVDYRSLEQPGESKGTSSSPLEWLLTQTTNTTTRDSEAEYGVAISDWVTDAVGIKIDPSK